MHLQRSRLEQNLSRVKNVEPPGHPPPTGMFQRKKKATHTKTVAPEVSLVFLTHSVRYDVIHLHDIPSINTLDNVCAVV